MIKKIDSDLITAQKNKDDVALSCLRMLKSAIKYAAIQKKKDSLEEPEIIEVIAKQIKQRKDSVQAYKDANRPELAQKEETEIKVLSAYLPAALSDEDLSKVIKDAIAKTGAQSKADMGKVMKVVMAEVRGRADGSKISQLVNQHLS